MVSKLSVKKDPLEKQHSKLENSRLGFTESMADATFFTPTSLVCSQISVEPYIPKGPANIKITTLYRCTGRFFRAATRAQRQLFLVLFLCFLVCQVRTCTFYMGPVTQKCVFRNGRPGLFQTTWSTTKAS